MIGSQTPSSLPPTYSLPVIHTKWQYLAVCCVTAFQKENLFSTTTKSPLINDQELLAVCTDADLWKKIFCKLQLDWFWIACNLQSSQALVPWSKRESDADVVLESTATNPACLIPFLHHIQGEDWCCAYSTKHSDSRIAKLWKENLGITKSTRFFFFLQVIHLTFVQVSSAQRLLPSSAWSCKVLSHLRLWWLEEFHWLQSLKATLTRLERQGRLYLTAEHEPTEKLPHYICHLYFQLSREKLKSECLLRTSDLICTAAIPQG